MNTCVIRLYLVGVSCCVPELIEILIVIVTHSSTDRVSHIAVIVWQWHTFPVHLLNLQQLVHCIISYCCNLSENSKTCVRD